MNTPALQNPSYSRGHRALEIVAIAFAFGSPGLDRPHHLHRRARRRRLDRHRARRAGRLHRVRLPVGLRALGGRHRGRREHAGLRAQLRAAVPATTTSIRRTSPGTTSSRPTATTASSPRPCCCWCWSCCPPPPALLFYTCVVIACTALFVFCTNQFHKWAHTKNPAGWVRAAAAGRADPVARRTTPSTTPRRSDKYYCITVGWMNPLLDKIRFFRFLRGRPSRASTRARCGPTRPTALRRPRTPRSRCRADPASRRRSPACATCGIGLRKRLSARLESEM